MKANAMDIFEISKNLNLLKQRIDTLADAVDLISIKENIACTEKKIEEEDFWNSEAYYQTMIDLSKKKKIVEKFNEMSVLTQDIEVILNILEGNPHDTDILDEGALLLKKLESFVEKTEYIYLFSDEYDINSCFFSINAGTGGTESCDWVEILYRMYTKWCDSKGFKIDVIDLLTGEIVGYKNITLKISGDFAYGYLKNENGIHRLVRNSPFDAKNKRHTSFASVYVTPVVDDDHGKTINILPEELEITTCRSSGAGGQHVNTTDSKVRVKHIPTGLTVTCQKERSQASNRKIAIDILKSKLIFIKKEEENKKIENLIDEKCEISWGRQCRNYVFSPYKLIKDLRSGYETSNIQAMLNGEILDFFIKPMLMLRCNK